jgi:hypothetical protein
MNKIEKKNHTTTSLEFSIPNKKLADNERFVFFMLMYIELTTNKRVVSPDRGQRVFGFVEILPSSSTSVSSPPL